MCKFPLHYFEYGFNTLIDRYSVCKLIEKPNVLIYGYKLQEILCSEIAMHIKDMKIILKNNDDMTTKFLFKNNILLQTVSVHCWQEGFIGKYILRGDFSGDFASWVPRDFPSYWNQYFPDNDERISNAGWYVSSTFKDLSPHNIKLLKLEASVGTNFVKERAVVVCCCGWIFYFIIAVCGILYPCTLPGQCLGHLSINQDIADN